MQKKGAAACARSRASQLRLVGKEGVADRGAAPGQGHGDGGRWWPRQQRSNGGGASGADGIWEEERGGEAQREGEEWIGMEGEEGGAPSYPLRGAVAAGVGERGGERAAASARVTRRGSR